MSCDLCPCFAGSNCPHGVLVHIKVETYLVLIKTLRGHSSYLSHVVGSKLCAWVVVTKRLVSSALSHLVPHIVRPRPEDQMFRITAWRPIARVHDVQTSRYRPVGQHPCLSMRVLLPSFPFQQPVLEMGTRLRTALPCPATFRPRGHINLVPKIFYPWNAWRHACRARALIVAATQIPGQHLPAAIGVHAQVVGRGRRVYCVLNQSESPSRNGQKHRAVTSGRCFAFMPRRQLLSQEGARA